MRTKFWSENLSGRDNLEDLDVLGDNIKMYFILNNKDSSLMIQLAYVRVLWRVFVNAVMETLGTIKGRVAKQVLELAPQTLLGRIMRIL